MSNKTQESSVEKTASGRNQTLLSTLLVLLAVSVLILARVLFGFLPDRRVTISNQKIDVIVADTPAERTKGLSGRERLAEREGMLFTFTDESEYCFWMKDMNFALDIVWLNEDRQVVSIKENATPESYPESFCPTKPAQYVLEVNANKAAEWGINVGDTANF